MINTYYILCVVLWLLLGIAADTICEVYSKKANEPYNKPIIIVAYIFGPIILLIAFVFAIIKGFRSFLK